MSVIHAPEETPLDARQLLVPAILVVAFLTFVWRLWYLQVMQANSLTERAQRTSEITVSKLAPRGLIVDRKNRRLASVKPQIVITAKPAIALKHPEAIEYVANLLGVPKQAIEKEIKDGVFRQHLPTTVFVGASLQAATTIAEAGDRLPGFGVETQAMRTYSDPVHFSHILGYVWTPTGNDEERLQAAGIAPADFIGRDGIERFYEKELMGVPGRERMQVDAKRRPVRTLGEDNPVAGTKLVLGIDLDVQTYAMQQLRGRRGSIVAVDPRNGEVLCMASSPSYDLSWFSGGISQARYQQLMDDPNKPLFKRAIGAAYAPGSTFKIVTTVAAMQSGKFDASRTHYCPGYFAVGTKKFRCANHPPGLTLSFTMAMAKSCNTFFGSWAQEIGPDALHKACHDLGLGDRTGIDVPGESSGNVPDEAWMRKNYDRKWFPGDTVNMGIGQGGLALTPLQMVTMVSLVANGGTVYRPHVVRSFVPSTRDGVPRLFEPQVLAQVEASPEFWRAMQNALVQVIEVGTAKRSQIRGVTWGGKTGSAENNRGITHSWFVGFAPADEPRVAICVMIENAGHGGDVAAPIAGTVMRRLLGLAEPPQAPASSSLVAASSANRTPAVSLAPE